MSWNGSGVFNRLYSWVTDFQNGLDINATRMDADTNDITTNGFGNCITRDGQGVATAQIPFAAGATFGSGGISSFDASGNLIAGGNAGVTGNLTVTGTFTKTGTNFATTSGSLVSGNIPKWSGTTGGMVDSGLVAATVASTLSSLGTAAFVATTTFDAAGTAATAAAAAQAAAISTSETYTDTSIATAVAAIIGPKQGIFFEDSGTVTTVYAFGGCSISRTGTGTYNITLGATALIMGYYLGQPVNNGAGDGATISCATTTALSASNTYGFTCRAASSKTAENASACLVLFY